MNEHQSEARGNRRIDRIRENAGSAKIPAGYGNIVSVKTVGNRLYLLAERGLISGVMADDIDPERINPDIPFMVQRVELGYGIEHQFMQNTVCVAFELISATHLPAYVNEEEGLNLAIEIATLLASVSDVVSELHAHQEETRAKAKIGELSLGYVPQTANLKGKVHQCIAALRSAEIVIQKATMQFYAKTAPSDPWDKRAKAAILAERVEQDGFAKYIDKLWKVLGEVADHRHSMVHPNSNKSLIVRDYELEPTGVFVAPTIEIKHPRSSVSRRDVAQFLDTQVADIAHVYASLIGYMCDINVRSHNDVFESFVSELPNGETRNGSNLVWQTVMKAGYVLPEPPTESPLSE